MNLLPNRADKSAVERLSGSLIHQVRSKDSPLWLCCDKTSPLTNEERPNDVGRLMLGPRRRSALLLWFIWFVTVIVFFYLFIWLFCSGFIEIKWNQILIIKHFSSICNICKCFAFKNILQLQKKKTKVVNHTQCPQPPLTPKLTK